ncbi:hypothetical protein MXD81_04780 [Microbacteriaceae bacterium K1510]|nr:hypothetical protein [Microbacteriaceae bacterium K1510]
MTRAIRIGLGAALLMLASPLQAAPVDTAGASRCETHAYLNDPDPKGTNVRAAPNGKAPVIGQLPPRAPMQGDDSEIVGVEFEIIGSKDGWLLVRNPDRGTFKGHGWIYGGLVSGTIGGPQLLASPASNAKVLAELHHEGETGVGPDSFEVMQVHACQGRFVEVTVKLAPSIAPYPGLPKQPMRGWVRKLCSTQVTTCDPS